MALVTLAGITAVFVALLGAIALERSETAAARGMGAANRAQLAERLNAVIYRVVMESRAIYAAKSTDAAKPFAANLLQALGEGNTVLDQLMAMKPNPALQTKFKEFTEFRKEVVRAGTQDSPKAADALGNNDANRANRAALNKLVDELVAIARQESAETRTALASETTVLQIAFVGGSLAIMAAMLVLAGWVVNRTIRRPLAETTQALEDVLAGRAVSIPHADRSDELGRIASMMEASQRNASGLRDMEALRQRSAEQADRRNRQMAELQQRFASVIARAAAGDLSQRIDARFDDADLNALGSHLDGLLDTLAWMVEETRSVTAQLAEGTLASRIDGQYAGAYGAMKDSINALAASFEDTLAQLTDSANTVRTATGEILAGVTDLASRTADQAAVVTAATTRLDSFAGGFTEAAQRAGQAVTLARAAEDSARDGSTVMAAASDAMGRIAGSSKKISDIIDLIDEIAFQTNLLALNAAVEAARAGESGRGFAVVAAEVRSLAQRAAGASNDVKQLIVSAQQDVQSGVDLVGQTSAVLDRIFGSVNDVSRIMDELAAQSRSQVEDIQVVSDEVGRIDEMTQQNAALVEETNAALAVTDQQTQVLEQLVSRFSFRQQAQANERRRAA